MGTMQGSAGDPGSVRLPPVLHCPCPRARLEEECRVAREGDSHPAGKLQSWATLPPAPSRLSVDAQCLTQGGSLCVPACRGCVNSWVRFSCVYTYMCDP